MTVKKQQELGLSICLPSRANPFPCLSVSGRVFAVGDHSYQGMKLQDRARMRIGGEEVVEIDINASYLTILYGISGFALPDRDDIYDLSGIDRAIVKAWITSTIGHHSFHSRWPKNAPKAL